MYNIYHIPGNRKIGLTINLKVRLREQGNPDYEVLEVHLLCLGLLVTVI